MASDGGPPKPSSARGSSRWRAGASTAASPYRLVLRLLGFPIIAVAGVVIYNGLRDRLVLPECDSARARQTLATVLKELKLEPLRYEPIKTISKSKDVVVCNAVLPLPDGADVVADYSFYWQGNTADMKYSVHREPHKASG